MGIEADAFTLKILVVLIFALVAVVLIKVLGKGRRISREVSRGVSEGASADGARQGDFEQTDAWQDTCKGRRYHVEEFRDSVVTVWVDIPAHLESRLEINARTKRPLVLENPAFGEIKALLDMGVNYIDISYNANWLAAELPRSNAPGLDRKKAERIVGHLIEIGNILG